LYELLKLRTYEGISTGTGELTSAIAIKAAWYSGINAVVDGNTSIAIRVRRVGLRIVWTPPIRAKAVPAKEDTAIAHNGGGEADESRQSQLISFHFNDVRLGSTVERMNGKQRRVLRFGVEARL